MMSGGVIQAKWRVLLVTMPDIRMDLRRSLILRQHVSLLEKIPPVR